MINAEKRWEMRYINKDTLLEAGHEITDNYLEKACRVDNDGNYLYQNVDYEGTFSSSGSKTAMLRLALDNQDYFCCYCMRDLHLQHQKANIEHIIPQNSDEARFGYYVGLNVAHLTADDVVLDSDFTGCDGTFPDRIGSSQCCNHRRGDMDVYPMFYVVGIEKDVTYTEDGSMQPTTECFLQNEYRETINNTRLNCSNLQDIRRLWHLFAGEQIKDLEESLSDKNMRFVLLMRVLYRDNKLLEQDARIHNKFMRDSYWKTFLLYHWFHQKI